MQWMDVDEKQALRMNAKSKYLIEAGVQNSRPTLIIISSIEVNVHIQQYNGIE